MYLKPSPWSMVWPLTSLMTTQHPPAQCPRCRNRCLLPLLPVLGSTRGFPEVIAGVYDLSPAVVIRMVLPS